METNWTKTLPSFGARGEALAWARTQPSLEAAWQTCERGDWMLWLAGRVSGPVGSPERRRLVGAAAACVRDALPFFEGCYPGDVRVRACLEMCDRYAAGDLSATPEALANAAAAARAAAGYAADGGSDAAATTAYAVSDVAYVAAAPNAAGDIAYAAAAPNAAASMIRQHYPTPPALPGEV